MRKPKPFTSRDPLTLTSHVRDTMRHKKISGVNVRNALIHPYKITEVRRYPGQWRYCGAGVAVVVAFDRLVPTVVTVYLDGVVTPMREDQRDDVWAINSKRLALK
jgi:hypothetical protein